MNSSGDGGFTSAGARSAATSGCCDNSPGQHATAHADATGHPWITGYEPEEHWFYDYRDQQFYDNGPQLTPPDHHPLDQPTPGPAARVPANWQQLLH